MLPEDECEQWFQAIFLLARLCPPAASKHEDLAREAYPALYKKRRHLRRHFRITGWLIVAQKDADSKTRRASALEAPACPQQASGLRISHCWNWRNVQTATSTLCIRGCRTFASSVCCCGRTEIFACCFCGFTGIFPHTVFPERMAYPGRFHHFGCHAAKARTKQRKAPGENCGDILLRKLQKPPRQMGMELIRAAWIPFIHFRKTKIHALQAITTC